VGDGCIWDHGLVDTAPLQSRMLTPEEADWLALKEREEEVED
jgi:hypothetical protein